MIASAAHAGDIRLLRRYHEWGDLHAREELVRRMTALVETVARHYRSDGDLEDVRQAAWLGLAKAIGRFDPGLGVPFRAYAAPTITGEVRRHLRDSSWAVRPPRRLQERLLAINHATDRLSSALGRRPTPVEIGRELGLTLDEVTEAIEAGRAYSAVSLQAPGDEAENGESSLATVLGEHDDRLEYVEHLADLRRLRGTLTEAERELLHLTFVHELTQREVAEVVGCSPTEVSRALRAALARLAGAAGHGA